MLLNYITQTPSSPPQLTPTASAAIQQQQQVLVETDEVIDNAEEEEEEVTLQQFVSNTEDDGHQNIFQYVSTSSTGSVIQAYTKSLQSTKSLRVRHAQQPPPLAPLQQKKIANKSASQTSSNSILQTSAQQQQQLPHKKRIATSPLTSSNPPKLLLQSPVQTMLPQQSATANTTTVTVFQCQLCSEPCATQYDFFQHLQSHYESTEAEEAEANTVGIEEPEQQNFGYEAKDSETLLQTDQHDTEQTERTNKSMDPVSFLYSLRFA